MKKLTNFYSAVLFLSIMVLIIIHACNSGGPTGTGGATDFEGNWNVAEFSQTGVPSPWGTWQISQNALTAASLSGENDKGTITVNASFSPKQIDLKVNESTDPTMVGKTVLGIYQKSGDSIMVAFGDPGTTNRPTSFAFNTNAKIFGLIKM